MKVRGLLIGAILLAGLSGLLYWSNEAEKAKENEPDPDASPKIIDVEEESITGLEIVREGEQTVALEKGEGDAWKIVAPEELAADSSAAESLVSVLAELESNRLIEESGSDLSPFGLDAPTLQVTATQTGGETLKLIVGNETPTGSNYFAKLESDPRIFTLASYNKTSLEKSAWDLRDKRLLTFDSATLSRVELTAKGGTVELGKNAQGDWQILKPRPLRADGGNVEQVVSRLRDAKMDSAMSADELKAAASSFARASRVAVAKVTDAAGIQELEVRKTSDDDYYAKSSIVSGVFKVTSTVSEGLDKGLADLRNHKLFDFGYNEPLRIEIRNGDATAVYEKTDDKWLLAGKQMDSMTVRALIDELRDLSAESFPESGFTEPYFEATVVTDEGNRVEKVLISKDGERYFAKRDNGPALYELKAIEADRLQAVAEDVKEHQEEPETADPEKPVE